MTVANYPSALGKRCINDIDDFDQDDDYETLYGPTDEIRPPPLFTCPKHYAKWTDEEFNDYIQDCFLLPPLPPPSPKRNYAPSFPTIDLSLFLTPCFLQFTFHVFSF